jgi:hypothetical protein
MFRPTAYSCLKPAVVGRRSPVTTGDFQPAFAPAFSPPQLLHLTFMLIT